MIAFIAFIIYNFRLNNEKKMMWEEKQALWGRIEKTEFEFRQAREELDNAREEIKRLKEESKKEKEEVAKMLARMNGRITQYISLIKRERDDNARMIERLTNE